MMMMMSMEALWLITEVEDGESFSSPLSTCLGCRWTQVDEGEELPTSARFFISCIIIKTLLRHFNTQFSRQDHDELKLICFSIFLLVFLDEQNFYTRKHWFLVRNKKPFPKQNQTLKKWKTKTSTNAIKTSIKMPKLKSIKTLRKLLSSFYPFYTNSSSNLNHVSHYSRTPSKEDLSPIRY